MKSIGLLLKVLWSPGEAMFLLSKNPRVIVPLAFILLLSIVTAVVGMRRLDSAELAMRAIERSPRWQTMPDNQRQQLRVVLNSPMAKGFTLAAALTGPLIMVVLAAGIYFAIFTMLGREGGFKAFLSITAFSFVPMVFRYLATVLTAYTVPMSAIMPDELGGLSPAVFVDRDSMSPILFAVINTVDLVSIWILALLIIGYGFVTRKSLSGAVRATAVIAVFLVYVGLKLLGAAVNGM